MSRIHCIIGVIYVIKLKSIFCIQFIQRMMIMKICLTVTIDKELFKEIERLRKREKRSTFVEYLLRLGLEKYKREERNEISR